MRVAIIYSPFSDFIKPLPSITNTHTLIPLGIQIFLFPVTNRSSWKISLSPTTRGSHSIFPSLFHSQIRHSRSNNGLHLATRLAEMKFLQLPTQKGKFLQQKPLNRRIPSTAAHPATSHFPILFTYRSQVSDRLCGHCWYVTAILFHHFFQAIPTATTCHPDSAMRVCYAYDAVLAQKPFPGTFLFAVRASCGATNSLTSSTFEWLPSPAHAYGRLTPRLCCQQILGESVQEELGSSSRETTQTSRITDRFPQLQSPELSTYLWKCWHSVFAMMYFWYPRRNA